MRIDERGRQAGASLRAQIGQVDVDNNLDTLLVSVRRRQYLRAAAAVAAAAAVVIGGLTVRDAVTRADVPPTTTPSSSTAPTGQCEQVFLQCEAGDRYTVQMMSSMTWTLPTSFDHTLHYYSDIPGRALLIESYRRSPGIAAGVTVAQNVFAARVAKNAASGDGDVVPDRTVRPGAHALASWLSQRPYLISSGLTPSTVDGRRAWTVQVRLRAPGRPGEAVCNGQIPCTPLLTIQGDPGSRMLGIWDHMISRYTIVDQGGPTQGTTAIWSWSFNGEQPLLGNQALIDTIRIGGG